jgi:hypothetical protein
MTNDGEVTVDKDTFQAMPLEGQMWLLFKTVQTQRKMDKHLQSEIDALKDQKKINTTLSTITGGISGFLTAIGGKLFG